MIGKIDVYYDGKNVSFHLEDGEGRVRISGNRHRQLLSGQANGKKIVTGGDGYPKLKTRAAPLASARDAKVNAIKKAYEKAMGQLDGYTLSRSGVMPAIAMECSIWQVSKDAADCPMLSAMAAENGVEMDADFVQDAMEKYHAFSSNAGQYSAKFERLERKARRAKSKSELEKIEW